MNGSMSESEVRGGPGDSARVRAVQSPIIPVVAELIRQHPGTISLGQGVVHYGPPPEAIARIQQFLEDPDNHKYRPVHGIPALREACSQKLRTENELDLEGAEVVVTAGSNMAFQNAILAIAEPGDEIVLQTPYYFNHEMAVTLAGCKPVLVPTDTEYQLQPDAVAAAVTPRTRAIVTISPNNPSGAVYSEAALRAINALCRERGLYHIHDEAYEYFTYDGARGFSPGAIPGSAAYTLSLFSLSKAYGFASWRIGYMTVPRRLSVAIEKIQDTILICPPVISQVAALGALEAGRAYCDAHLDSIAAVRRIAREELAALADICTVPEARGAFYLLLKVHTHLTSMALVERLIREHGVAVIPGTAFGMEEGCAIRVSYAALRKETVAVGLGRLVVGLKALAQEERR